MNFEKNYNYWLNHKDLDENLKKELLALSKEEAYDCFYTDVKFQTAGMRGLLGVGTNRLNIYTIRKATLGFARYLNKNNLNGVAIGYDNRHFSKEFAYDCAKLLASYNIDVYLFDSLRPTPELSFATRYYKCAGGIMITASHNPKQYNGYKLYDSTGCQLTPTLAQIVIDEINSIDDILSIKPSDNYNKDLIHIINDECDEKYYEEVVNISLRNDVNKNFSIAFSPEHGASYNAVMSTLKMKGYTVYEVLEQSNPDPNFSNTKTPNPEEQEAYEKVFRLAKEKDSDLVLICDPDGDRMGVGCKHNCQYVLLNGNQTGALLMNYIFDTLKQQGKLPENACMFNTVVTSDIGEAVANYYGVECEKTLTGFKYIGDKVRQYEQNHKKEYVFGYEESYGSLIKPFVRDKDATQACLMLAEACGYYLSQNKSLMDVIYDIFELVGAYADSQFSISLPGADGALKLQSIMENLRKDPIKFDDYEIVKIEDYKLKTVVSGEKETKLIGFDTTDLIKYYLNDGSFVAIRPSGTEPKCKVYLSIKAKTYDLANQKMEKLAIFLKDIIK